LRTLDYSQRLRDRSRAALATPEKSTGRVLFEGAARAARRRRGATAARSRRGGWPICWRWTPMHVDLEGRTGDTLLDAWIFAGDDRMVRDVWAAGRHRCATGGMSRATAISAPTARLLRRLRAL
jgi:formimidoylglutamate deiminase